MSDTQRTLQPLTESPHDIFNLGKEPKAPPVQEKKRIYNSTNDWMGRYAQCLMYVLQDVAKQAGNGRIEAFQKGNRTRKYLWNTIPLWSREEPVRDLSIEIKPFDRHMMPLLRFGPELELRMADQVTREDVAEIVGRQDAKVAELIRNKRLLGNEDVIADITKIDPSLRRYELENAHLTAIEQKLRDIKQYLTIEGYGNIVELSRQCMIFMPSDLLYKVTPCISQIISYEREVEPKWPGFLIIGIENEQLAFYTNRLVGIMNKPRLYVVPADELRGQFQLDLGKLANSSLANDNEAGNFVRDYNQFMDEFFGSKRIGEAKEVLYRRLAKHSPNLLVKRKFER